MAANRRNSTTSTGLTEPGLPMVSSDAIADGVECLGEVRAQAERALSQSIPVDRSRRRRSRGCPSRHGHIPRRQQTRKASQSMKLKLVVDQVLEDYRCGTGYGIENPLPKPSDAANRGDVL